MKHKLLLISFIYSFIAAQTSYAMENEQKTLRAASFKQPNCAQYVTDQSIVVGDLMGCRIIDFNNVY